VAGDKLTKIPDLEAGVQERGEEGEREAELHFVVTHVRCRVRLSTHRLTCNPQLIGQIG